ncbi:MAG: F420-0--gamma-glutamyl ligase [Clostridiales bacterium]|mgnify:CR=1 FL=1|nr:F420-0--gamma-glutamyl ligase [Clostridiales bacterium]
MRYTGVVARGIITPIFKYGDDVIEGITESLMAAAENENIKFNDGDIVGVTEALVARTQGNYATCEQIAEDVRSKFGGEDMGIVFPILSRNRFSILLKAISMATKKLYVQLSYPYDEVGNPLVKEESFEESGVNPYTDSFTEEEFRKIFDKESTIHCYTGIDYIEYYKNINSNIEIIFSNDPTYILKYTKNVLNCDIHTRMRTQRLIKKAGAKISYRLDEIMASPVGDSGYNPQYGLLGSNMATEDKVKLFPKDTQEFVDALAAKLRARTGKNIEVLIYGDGGFKDPVSGIWEFADPVVAPAYTSGLVGTPNELKIKYFADNEFASLSGEDLTKAMKEQIKQKERNLVGNMKSQGTTPRNITDLVGSLCDLVSGSGDRGTPVVLIQNYFKNYASE